MNLKQIFLTLLVLMSMSYIGSAGLNQIYCNPVTGSTINGGGTYNCVSPYFTYDYSGSITVKNPDYYPVTMTVSSGPQYFTLTPILTSITWDKSEYTQGEVATITTTFNSTTFNTNTYGYILHIVDTTGSHTILDQEISNRITTVKVTIPTQDAYKALVFVYPKSDMLSGWYTTPVYATITNGDIISFITWEPHNFKLGDTGKISYGISSSMYDYLYTYSIYIYNGNTIVQKYESIPNFGSYNYQFLTAGSYTAKLIKTAITDTEMKSDSATVLLPTSSIRANKTVYNTDETITLSGNKYPYSNEKPYFYVVISHFQSLDTVKSTQVYGVSPYSFSLNYNLPVGRYTGSLYGTSSLNDCAIVDNPSVCYTLKDYVSFDVVAPNNQSTNKPDMNISWKEAQYKLWDSASFSYQNTTNSDIVNIIDNLGKVISNFRTDQYPYSSTVQIDSDPKYIGTWTAKIINGSNPNDYKTSTMQVISASQTNYSNGFGITMNWNRPYGVPGKQILTWNTGTYSGNYNIKLVDGITGNFILQFPFSTSTVKAQQYEYVLDGSHSTYTAQFIDNTSIIQASTSIDIKKSVTAPTNPDYLNPINAPVSGDNIVSTGIDLLAVFGHVAFYGFVIWFAIAWMAKDSKNGIAIMWFAAIFCALAGLFDPYKMYVIVMSTITSAVLFKAGRNATTGMD